MRHLLSPPTCLSVAAEREAWLHSADRHAALAERLELKAVAVIHCSDPARSTRGKAYAFAAKQARLSAAFAHSMATDLTDYTEPLDRERESWILLATLQEDAARRAPHPVVFRPRKR